MHIVLHASWGHCTGCQQKQEQCCLDGESAFLHVAAGAKTAISMNKLVTQLRKQRLGMVQTVQQYVFIYQSIYDELQAVLSSVGQVQPQPGPSQQQQTSRQARWSPSS